MRKKKSTDRRPPPQNSVADACQFGGVVGSIRILGKRPASASPARGQPRETTPPGRLSKSLRFAFVVVLPPAGSERSLLSLFLARARMRTARFSGRSDFERGRRVRCCWSIHAQHSTITLSVRGAPANQLTFPTRKPAGGLPPRRALSTGCGRLSGPQAAAQGSRRQHAAQPWRPPPARATTHDPGAASCWPSPRRRSGRRRAQVRAC